MLYPWESSLTRQSVASNGQHGQYENPREHRSGGTKDGFGASFVPPMLCGLARFPASQAPCLGISMEEKLWERRTEGLFFRSMQLRIVVMEERNLEQKPPTANYSTPPLVNFSKRSHYGR